MDSEHVPKRSKRHHCNILQKIGDTNSQALQQESCRATRVHYALKLKKIIIKNQRQRNEVWRQLCLKGDAEFNETCAASQRIFVRKPGL